MTPLMWAAWRRTPGGGDFPSHSRKSDGETALHYAAQFGQIDVTKWLIDKGCSPWVKTKQGKTPYDLVKIERRDDEERKRKKEEVMDFLKRRMSSPARGSPPYKHEHFQDDLNRKEPDNLAIFPEAPLDLEIDTDPPSKQEIQAAIKSLKNKKSPGIDQLNAELFKKKIQC
ncbi:unnamed protein product [Mytilus edulis]|uniref:Uncharacterized protein n=1 Tax=Mytilus edulis TaxID=6550 RepID=A0A8S3TQD8_MYTED|nr:unnamed protein product [Mytilus edulis]